MIRSRALNAMCVVATTLLIVAVDAHADSSERSEVTLASTCSGCFTELPLPRQGSRPYAPVVAADGTIWVTEKGSACDQSTGNAVVHIDDTGEMIEYPVRYPSAMTVGPDTALWFGEQVSNKIGRLDLDGTLTEYAVPTGGMLKFPDCSFDSSSPAEGGIVVGPDSSVWFTETVGNNVARLACDGSIKEYPVPTTGSGPLGLTVGPDGALWFIERLAGKVGRMTLDGTMTEYPMADPKSVPNRIVTGPDGALWFTEFVGEKVGRITTDGIMTEFSTPGVGPVGIAAGIDGGLWIAGFNSNEIVRVSVEGSITNRYAVPTENSQVLQVVAAPDGSIWFTEVAGNRVGRLQIGMPS